MSIPYWKQQMLDAQDAKDKKDKYPDLGKIVRYKGETGVVVLSSDFDLGDGEELCVRWDTRKKFDFEQYGFFPYKYLDEYDFKYINIDGTLK